MVEWMYADRDIFLLFRDFIQKLHITGIETSSFPTNKRISGYRAIMDIETQTFRLFTNKRIAISKGMDTKIQTFNFSTNKRTSGYRAMGTETKSFSLPITKSITCCKGRKEQFKKLK